MHTLAHGPSGTDGTGTAATGAPRWGRVLVFRSCRTPQFRSAVTLVRRAHPGVHVTALAPPSFDGDVRTAGADDVVLYRARRLGALAIGLTTLRLLRAARFDAVVVPIMDDTLAGSTNLLRLASAIGAPETVISPRGTTLRPIGARALRRLALARSLGWSEHVVVLAQLLRALWTPRRQSPVRSGRLRVLHIINSLGLGGAQTQCAALVNQTPSDRYETSVLVLADDGRFSQDRFVRDDVPLTFLRCDEGETPVDAIADICRRGRFDVVHTWLSLPNMYGAAAARLAGVPRVLISLRSASPGHFPQWCRWWFRPADIMAYRLADVVTLNATAHLADHARWACFPATRFTIVHNGLDPARVAPAADAPRERLRRALGVPATARIVGIVGRLSEEKDHATFLQIVHALHRGGRPCHAVIVGDGSCETDLRTLAATLGLAPVVTFLGARPDAIDVMAGLDALVLTSRVEGFPNVILEAALLGVPIVSTPVGGVLDVITEKGCLFPVRDVQAGADALARVLDDSDWARRTADQLRRRCLDRFTTDRMVATWLSLYEPLTAGRPRPLQLADARVPTWHAVAQGEPR